MRPTAAPAPLLEGIEAHSIDSDRLSTRVLFSAPEEGETVLFLHGNLSSATWWEETMLALPAGYRGVAPDLRGYGGADPEARVDATRGLGDYVDDAIALLVALGIDRTHLIGSSLGGAIVWRLMATAPSRIRTVTQVAPGSPYGFGGTRDVAGTPVHEDYAGSGGGLVNPELVARIAAGDDSTRSPFSPRNALRALVYKPPFIPQREDALVAALLGTHIGADAYPGDVLASPNWPFVAPGVNGPNNGLSPKYVGDPADVISCDPKPPVLWIRGADDLAVSDTAAGDPGTWGPMGLVPGYPGPQAYPQQPMVGQTRDVLERYATAGGAYTEVVIDDCGHVPYIERAREFNRVFHGHLTNQGNHPTGGIR